MNEFLFSYPIKVYFGEGSAAQAFSAERGKVGETGLLAYGGSAKKNGIYDELKLKLEQAGKQVMDALENFIKECGLPTKMDQLKSTVEITPEVLRQVADTCNVIQCGPRQLDREEIYEILMECM